MDLADLAREGEASFGAAEIDYFAIVRCRKLVLRLTEIDADARPGDE